MTPSTKVETTGDASSENRAVGLRGRRRVRPMAEYGDEQLMSGSLSMVSTAAAAPWPTRPARRPGGTDPDGTCGHVTEPETVFEA